MEPVTVAAVAAAILAVLVGGHGIAHWCPPRIARVLAWSMLIVGTPGIERLVNREPPGVRMVSLIVFALLAMKVIVVIEERTRGMVALSFAAWLSFAGAWLGMRPSVFTSRRKGPCPGGNDLIHRGLAHASLGAILVVLARTAWTTQRSQLVATVLALVGFSLILHFGACNVMAGAWRGRGIACEPLFRAPLRSQNLAEFWARRWNVAFSEMTAIAVYRPLAEHVGRGPALVAGFALSGLLHEMAISVPVRAGIGGPLLYFLLHGALVLVERTLSTAGRPVKGWPGRVWVVFWLAAPLPILFHRPFLAGVVWPVIGVSAGD